MDENEAKKHVKVETDLTETSGPESAHERMNAEPEADNLTDAEDVWQDAERTPAAEKRRPIRGGGAHRVADAGDVGAGQVSPYSTETQADALARQTGRSGEKG